MDHDYRVTAVFDDGGYYTSTHANQSDALSRYDMFRHTGGRKPAFVGLFVREGTGVVLARQFTGLQSNEIIVAELPA